MQNVERRGGSAATPIATHRGDAQETRAAIGLRTQAEFAQAYNRLIDDTLGVASMFDGYLGLHLESRHPNPDSFSADPHTLEAVVQDLKLARSRGSSIGVLDLSVEKVIADGEALLDKWKPLHPYFLAKGFVLDGYARASAADPGMRTAFRELARSVDGLGTELGRAQDDLRAANMARLKARGDMIGFQLLDAMVSAKKFVDTLGQTEAPASRHLEEQLRSVALRASLQDYAMTIDNARASGVDRSEDAHEALLQKLQAMVDAWSSFGPQRSPLVLRKIVADYNDAIDIYDQWLARE